MLTLAFILIFLFATGFYSLSRRRAILAAAGDLSRLHSRPSYHGFYAFSWVLITGWSVLIALSLLWSYAIDFRLAAVIAAAPEQFNQMQSNLILEDAKAIAFGRLASDVDALREQLGQLYLAAENTRQWAVAAIALAMALGAGFYTRSKATLEHRARNRSEGLVRLLLWASAAVAVLTTIGIIMSLIFETLTFFGNIGWRIDKFLFGTTWSPLSGVQEGVIDVEKIGALSLFAGTFLITLIAMVVAVPIGLFAAIFLSEFASPRARGIIKPMLEILAGVPTVVYGFFAAITVAPFIRGMGESLGLSIASESALAAGIVMGIMIIPFISSLSDDVINAVPQSLREGSYGLGATQAETISQVVLPAALPGIVSAVLLGVSRAVGETMIVVMAAGQGANLTANPFEAVTTVTVQIVMLITGDTEAKTAAGPAFTLGFTLFVLTLILNIIALKVVRKYRELYD